MRPITDKAFLFRTFPVDPRRRVKFDPDVPVRFTLYQSEQTVCEILGGYNTSNSYNLMDYFVSRWFEIASSKWSQITGTSYPKRFSFEDINRLKSLSPILTYSTEELLQINNSLAEIFNRFRDYIVFEDVGDREMRKHPSLARLSSKELYNVIDRTSQAEIRTTYPLRIIKGSKYKTHLGWFNRLNADNSPWSHIYGYQLLSERRGTDGRIIERNYRFVFNTFLGVLIIHNTICKGWWDVNLGLYGVSADAQLLYRYLIIVGSRSKNNLISYVGHRLARREKQKRRLIVSIESILNELVAAELLSKFEISEGNKNYLSFEINKKKTNRG